jgi:tRNA-modifying protein YgfZ
VDATKNEVGQIVRVAANTSNSFDALIEMRIDAQEIGAVYWNNALITTKNLPYSLNT